MGVVNVTPDSFSDGGRFIGPSGDVAVPACVDAAAELVAAGAHVLDVGGESTRPGAGAVSVAEEASRTAPVVEALAARFDAAVSIDTRKAAVAQAALAVGATVVNDVSGLRFDEKLARVAAEASVELIIGHARGTPDVMQDDPHYDDSIGEIVDELGESVALAEAAGVARHRITVDPGIGFGKRLEDNLTLLARIDELCERLDFPVLVGPSRKSFLGTLTGADVQARDAATFAACAIAVFNGAHAVRVHDVAGAAQSVAVASALREARVS